MIAPYSILPKRRYKFPTENLSAGGVKYMGVGKIHDFRQKSTSETNHIESLTHDSLLLGD